MASQLRRVATALLPSRCVVAGLTARHALVGYALAVNQAAGQNRLETALCRIHDADRGEVVHVCVHAAYAPGLASGTLVFGPAAAARGGDFALVDSPFPRELQGIVLQKIGDVLRADPCAALGREAAFAPGAARLQFGHGEPRAHCVPLVPAAAPLGGEWLLTGYWVLSEAGHAPAAAPAAEGAATDTAAPGSAGSQATVRAVLCQVLAAADDADDAPRHWALVGLAGGSDPQESGDPTWHVEVAWVGPEGVPLSVQRSLAAALTQGLPQVFAGQRTRQTTAQGLPRAPADTP